MPRRRGSLIDDPATVGAIAMRLLIDCTPLHAGGGVQVAVALMEALAGTDVAWRAVVPEPVRVQLPDALRDRPELICLPKKGAPDIFPIGRALSAIEKDQKPRLVFTVFGPAYFKARAPHLVGFALPDMVYPPPPGLPFPGLKARLADRVRRHLLRRADHLVVETESFKARTAAAIGFDPARIHVVRNAVNPVLERFPRTPVAGSIPQRILVPSAFYPHKNLIAVPAVAAALAADHPHVDAVFQLTIPADSEAWREIAARARSLGVADRVETLGLLQLDALAAAYTGSAAVFLPTLREASTAVYPESFHFGRPLVTTDIDFARELCGAAAMFVDPYDEQGMAAALAHVLADETRRLDLIAAGDVQLAQTYPSAKGKFAAQLAMFEAIAGNAAC